MTISPFPSYLSLYRNDGSGSERYGEPLPASPESSSHVLVFPTKATATVCGYLEAKSHSMLASKVFFLIQVVDLGREPAASWQVFRRFSSWQQLFEVLRKRGIAVAAAFPAKKWLGMGNNVEHLDSRREALQVSRGQAVQPAGTGNRHPYLSCCLGRGRGQSLLHARSASTCFQSLIGDASLCMPPSLIPCPPSALLLSLNHNGCLPFSPSSPTPLSSADLAISGPAARLLLCRQHRAAGFLAGRGQLPSQGRGMG